MLAALIERPAALSALPVEGGVRRKLRARSVSCGGCNAGIRGDERPSSSSAVDVADRAGDCEALDRTSLKACDSSAAREGEEAGEGGLLVSDEKTQNARSA